MTEQQLLRMAKRRLAILRHPEEITGNVSLTCRYYGISRQCFSTWRRRYDAHGLDGLRDRSHRPQVSPKATRTEVVGKIISLGQHDHFGPARIAMYLKCYHEVQISNSGVWRILKRLELNRLPPPSATSATTGAGNAMSRPLPGHRVQLDVKFIAPLAGSRRKHYQVTAIDDCTRLRVLRIYPQLNQQTAIQFLDYVLERLPFRVEVIQTDNGVEFGASFHWHVLDKGIGHVYIKPRTPRLNGKVERSHRIDAEEFYHLLDGVVIDDTKLFNDKLREGRTSTTTTGPTAASTARRPMRDSSNEPRPGCNPSPSLAHRVGEVRSEGLLYELKAAPAGGRLRRPSSRRQRHDGNGDRPTA